MEDVGIKQLVSELKKNVLEQLMKPLHMDLARNGNNPGSRMVLQKRLCEKMIQFGIEEFLFQFSEKTILQEIIDHFGEHTSVPSGASKEDLIHQVVQLVTATGMTKFLNRFDVQFLNECAKELSLGQSSSLQKVIEAIVTLQPVKMEKRELLMVPVDLLWEPSSNSKPEIKTGISFGDIMHWFSREELQLWCKQNMMSAIGTKIEITKRILDSLSAKEENGSLKNTKSPASPIANGHLKKEEDINKKIIQEEHHKEKTPPLENGEDSKLPPLKRSSPERSPESSDDPVSLKKQKSQSSEEEEDENEEIDILNSDDEIPLSTSSENGEDDMMEEKSSSPKQEIHFMQEIRDEDFISMVSQIQEPSVPTDHLTHHGPHYFPKSSHHHIHHGHHGHLHRPLGAAVHSITYHPLLQSAESKNSTYEYFEHYDEPGSPQYYDDDEEGIEILQSYEDLVESFLQPVDE